MVKKAKKTHDLPSASWRTSKASYNSVWVQRAENPRGCWYIAWNPMAWETEASLSKGRRKYITQVKKRENSPFLCCFALFRPSKDNMMPVHIGEGGSSLFSLIIQVLISSRDTLTDTPRKNVLPAIWASHSPVKLTHKINHHMCSTYCVQETVQCYKGFKRHFQLRWDGKEGREKLNSKIRYHLTLENMFKNVYSSFNIAKNLRLSKCLSLGNQTIEY